ncbi:hypothetical protein CTAYLR_004415 [Chrysophaeum taylorii]|uniref:Anamorsin homolog n=1 Tax=Chrysophaeum taylorii TaxID=2483200 RepID=A0AAD7UMI5_9STRA|nr:hypothetical protein CTAYLR_004415 [Chrysophaeum taylorii]
MDELKVSANSTQEIQEGAAGWNESLRPGGKLMLSLANEALVAEAKLPLLLGGFVISLEESSEKLLCASKPEWETGASAPLKLGDDVVDEDELLAADGLEPPSVPDDVGCSTARKPCANCTCGRADQLAAEEAHDADAAPLSSSCGNCHKGDAFRCEGCPYLGKPAFKPGEEKLILEMTDDL